MVQISEFLIASAYGIFECPEVAEKKASPSVGYSHCPLSFRSAVVDTTVSGCAGTGRFPSPWRDGTEVVREVQTSEVSENGSGFGVVGAGGLFGSVVEAEVSPLNRCCPFAFEAIDALGGYVAPLRSAVPHVLLMGAYAEILAPIIEAVSVDMVNLIFRAGSENESVHGHRTGFSAAVVTPLRVQHPPRLVDAPLESSDTLVVGRVNDRAPTSGQFDVANVHTAHCTTFGSDAMRARKDHSDR
jgi:hypothetical protein